MIRCPQHQICMPPILYKLRFVSYHKWWTQELFFLRGKPKKVAPQLSFNENFPCPSIFEEAINQNPCLSLFAYLSLRQHPLSLRASFRHLTNILLTDPWERKKEKEKKRSNTHQATKCLTADHTFEGLDCNSLSKWNLHSCFPRKSLFSLKDCLFQIHPSFLTWTLNPTERFSFIPSPLPTQRKSLVTRSKFLATPTSDFEQRQKHKTTWINVNLPSLECQPLQL